MKLVATFVLDNRHWQDESLLEAMMRDAVVTFNRKTHADADLQSIRLFSDDAQLVLKVNNNTVYVQQGCPAR